MEKRWARGTSTLNRTTKEHKAAGLPVGVYWYSYARDCKAVEEEARACLTVIQGKQFEFPVFFDLEEKYQVSQGKSFCDALVKTFCGAMEKAGYFTGLYMSRYYLQNCISAMVAKRYALWIAEYGYKCEYQGDYGMWQYTSNGAVSGIHGRVDRNFAYKDYPAIIKKAGLNGYGKK
jgi:lysozyme